MEHADLLRYLAERIGQSRMPLCLRIVQRAALLVSAIQFVPVASTRAEPATIQKSNARLAQTTRHPQPFPSLPRNRPPRIGDKGTLVNRRATIVQIMDDSNALASVDWYSERKELIGDPRKGIVVDRIDNRHEMVWLRLPTKGLVNGQTISLNQVFAVTQTTGYQTARGARTVMFLQPAE